MHKNYQRSSIIVAMDDGGGISKDGEIPWNFKSDWEHFKATTANSICIMGRKTAEDILKRKKNPQKTVNLLPNRTCYVVSRNSEYAIVGAISVTSVDEAMEDIGDDPRNIFILGGESIYEETFMSVGSIFVTLITHTDTDADFDCDAMFPFTVSDYPFSQPSIKRCVWGFKLATLYRKVEGNHTLLFMNYVKN